MVKVLSLLFPVLLSLPPFLYGWHVHLHTQGFAAQIVTVTAANICRWSCMLFHPSPLQNGLHNEIILGRDLVFCEHLLFNR